jgi:MFS family permease
MAYMAFIVISILPVMVYAQMNTTMPVYMRDIGHIPPQEGYSYLLALNAFLVVTLQLWVTRRISKYAPLPILALGVVLYSIGFGMFGFSTYLPFLFLAMVIITFGELIGAPTAQAVAARFAPEDMRGRYLAMFNFSWALPFALGPYLAGWVWVQISPQWMWYAAGLLGLVGALAYLGLHRWAGRRITTASQENESAAHISEISAG